MLLKKLLTEDVYKELPDKLNLILIPMENVDGAATVSYTHLDVYKRQVLASQDVC